MISTFLPLILLLAAVLAFLLWRDRGRRDDGVARGRAKSRRPGETRPEVLLDGSNVMHWKDNVPGLEALRLVIDEVALLGYLPGVIFDANAGYKLFERYRDDGAMSRALGLPEAQVLVVPKGEVADRYLLEVSRSRGAPIVTNDRYRDWIAAYPEAAEPGRLIRGGFRDGRLWLDLDPVSG